MAYDAEWVDRKIVEAFPKSWPWVFIGRAVLLVVIGAILFVGMMR